MKVEISEVICEQDINPAIVNFENGKICDGLESELLCEMFKNKANNSLLGAYTNKMLYMGEINSEDNLQYSFIVIKKKTTNKVHLVNLDHISLKPYIKKSNGVLDTSISTEKVTNAELNKQFGSKKTKRNTEQRERLKLDIENVKDQLEQTVATIKIDDYFLNNSQTITETESTYKPPINRDAASPADVYILENLIPSNVLDALENEVNLFIESEDFSELKFFSFSEKNIIALKNHISVGGNMTKCKIFVYINYLMKFLATPAKSLTKKYVLCKTSKEVDSHILNNFSILTGANRSRPMSMRDKSICYILVLAMLASDYSLDLEDLSKDLKIGIKKLQEMSRILAFSITSSKTVVLKLPLPAPVVFNSKRKRS